MLEAIEQAIEAQRSWSLRLRRVIETSAFDLSTIDASSNHVCEFGKWLYSDSMPVIVRSHFCYTNVMVRHATFHKYASEVLLVALAGEKDKALALMERNSGYELSSTMLIHSLREWQAECQTECLQLNQCCGAAHDP